MNRYYPWAIITSIVAIPLVGQQILAQSSLYQEARQFVVLIQNTSGIRQGTGFIVNKDNNTYYVLTAAHVVRSGQFQVRTNSGEVKSVDVVNILGGEDLALVQFTSSNNYPSARLTNDANAVQVQSVISILGYPSSESGDPQIPNGIVTSRQRTSSGTSLAIVHNVETKQGMSGSPVFTANGEIVGVHIGRDPDSFRDAIPIEKYRELAPSVFTQAGRDHLAAGRFEQAITSLEQVKRLFGQDNPEALVIVAYAYFGLRNLDRAKEEAGKAIRINPNNAEASLLLGTIDYLQRNFSGAIDNLNRTNTIDSRNLGGYALAISGLTYAESSSNGREANSNASRAINQLSNDSFVYLARSCVRIKTTEDIEGAKSDLGNANRLGQIPPENPFLAVLRPRLEETARSCLPAGLLEMNIPPTTPIPTGRYKYIDQIPLSEESTGLAVSRDSRFIATGLRDGTISIYELATRRKVTSFNSGQGREDISSIAFSSNGRDIAIAAANGAVRVFNIESQQEKYSFANVGSRPLLVFNNTSNVLFIGTGNGILRMVDNRNGGILVDGRNAHPNGIASLALSPDSRFLASGGNDGVVKIWNTSDLVPIDRYQAYQSGVISLAFSQDSSQIISVGSKVVKSCNWQNKTCTDIANTRDDLNSLAVASNGHIAFSEVSFLIKSENPVFLQNLQNGQSLGTLLGHRDRIVSLAYTLNNGFLISGSSDGTLIIWEVQ